MHTRISIVHVIPAIANEASGPSYSVVRLCETLIDRSDHVALAALRWSTISSSRPFVTLFELSRGLRRLGVSPEMNRWLRALALSHGMDIIHSHGLWMMPNIYAGRAARAGACTLIVSPRGTLSSTALARAAWRKRAFWTLYQRDMLRRATGFHATAESELADIRRLGFRQPVAIIPNGVDIPMIGAKREASHRQLLYLGRIDPIKGLNDLLRAWSAVSRRFPEWELRIAGPDERGYLRHLVALRSKLNLERVTFTGPVYGAEKVAAYRQADLFVLPSHSENFGMVVAEALASATPVVTTRGAPWRGLPERGAGWWIETGVDPLVACLEEALSLTRQHLVDCGLRGRDWMEKEFSWARVGRMMDDAYRWFLGHGTVPEWVRCD